MGRQPMGDGIVARSAVLQRLRAARGGDLVAVRAPAGYGKTTAVALWDDAEERDFAWVRIDGLDDDPAHLLLHIATAVDRVCGLDPAVLRYLSGPGRAPIPQLIPALIEALESCGPMVVVLDDVHELSSRDAVDTLHAFVDAAPANVTVAVIGRWPLEAARRRLQDRVIDIGIDDLRQCADSPRARRLVQSLCRWSLTLMNDGAPLALRVPGRAGWELRLVVQGGLRILEKIDRMDHAALTQRPKLTAMDAPLLLWRALRMSGHRA